MIFNDNDKHHKPNVHVYYGENEASVALDGEVLEGKIPVKQYRMVAGWMAILIALLSICMKTVMSILMSIGI